MGKMRGLKEFERDLIAYGTTKVIHEHLVAKYLKVLVQALIGSARAAIGPDNQKYPAYSPKYAAKKQKAGGMLGNWLRGTQNIGRTGGMLDEKRFSGEVRGDGRAFVVWSPAGARMGIYGEVHQKGLPIGRNGPSKQRKWLHFENAANQAALVQAYEQTFDELAAQFSAGQTPK